MAGVVPEHSPAEEEVPLTSSAGDLAYALARFEVGQDVEAQNFGGKFFEATVLEVKDDGGYVVARADFDKRDCEKQGAEMRRAVPRCRKNHLPRCVVKRLDYVYKCDVCNLILPETGALWRCSVCRYDVCQQCSGRPERVDLKSLRFKSYLITAVVLLIVVASAASAVWVSTKRPHNTIANALDVSKLITDPDKAGELFGVTPAPLYFVTTKGYFNYIVQLVLTVGFTVMYLAVFFMNLMWLICGVRSLQTWLLVAATLLEVVLPLGACFVVLGIVFRGVAAGAAFEHKKGAAFVKYTFVLPAEALAAAVSEASGSETAVMVHGAISQILSFFT